MSARVGALPEDPSKRGHEEARLRILSCGIFARELGCIDPALRSRIKVDYLDSLLHMRPSILEHRIEEALAEKPGEPAVLLYGDCCPRMRELGSGPGRERTEGRNCVEIALGAERFKSLLREGAFFFMPEWVERWKEIFSSELGFADLELARSFLQESAKLLVYVDTGCMEPPASTLEEIGHYFDLPVRVERAGLLGIEAALRAAIERLDSRGEETGPPANDRAFEFLFSDLVEGIMSQADDPHGCIAFIAAEIRNLVGARTILVFETPRTYGEASFSLVSVLPERRRVLGEDPAIRKLAELCGSLEKAAFIEAGRHAPAGQILSELGIGDSLFIPLKYGSMRVGVVLLLDLMDLANVGSLLSTFDRLSPILALIMRNASLFENLESEVERRTAQLEAKSAELEVSLREKEVLLKEIHHRVKNNLQVVNSFLYLRMCSIDDQRTRALFEESQNRVHAMALVHEELYRSVDLSRIDMQEYISKLVGHLIPTAPMAISVGLDVEAVRLSPDEAIPCGLLIDELIMNAMKHAYVGRAGGRLDLSLHQRDGNIEIEVADDGPGLDGSLLDGHSSGLGLSIIRSLADQLHGSLSLGPGPGARFRLSFSPTPT